jgi:endonuclease YncB( thermonuclease family)
MKCSGFVALLSVSGCLLMGCEVENRLTAAHRQDIEVLDGDTLIFEGQWVRVRGIDAPELGPWAACWSEAGLGGASRDVMLGAISSYAPWSLTRPSSPDERGMVTADLVSEDGGDLADHMTVYGYAASTDGEWDWCGTDADLHSPGQHEPRPHGPNLWWPTNHMFDERAGD